MNKKLNFYKDLSKTQRLVYGNGCGPSFFCIDKIIPEFEWNLACREHDFYYDCGGTSDDRDWADQNFRTRMKRQLEKHGNQLQKVLLMPLVEVYYQAVKHGGVHAFDYGPYITLKALITKAEKKYGIKLK